MSTTLIKVIGSVMTTIALKRTMMIIMIMMIMMIMKDTVVLSRQKMLMVSTVTEQLLQFHIGLSQYKH